MNTYLGVSSLLSADDLDEAAIADGAVLYMEGYLFDRDDAKKAFRRAAGVAHANGRKVSLTLSDSFCVDRHRDDFAALVRDEVDILFGNARRAVLAVRAGVARRRDRRRARRVRAGRDHRRQGRLVRRHRRRRGPGAGRDVARVLDTTGAGDLYAAGFLYGYTQSRPLDECARLGLDRRRRGDQPRRARGRSSSCVRCCRDGDRRCARSPSAGSPPSPTTTSAPSCRRCSTGPPTMLAERFAGRLTFGTAGLRAAVGRRAAADEPARRAPGGRGASPTTSWRSTRGPPSAGVVIGYDARRKSDVFAVDTARVMAAAGLPVHAAARAAADARAGVGAHRARRRGRR